MSCVPFSPSSPEFEHLGSEVLNGFDELVSGTRFVAIINCLAVYTLVLTSLYAHAQVCPNPVHCRDKGLDNLECSRAARVCGEQ